MHSAAPSNAGLVRLIFEEGWNQQRFGYLADRTAPAIPFHYHGTTTHVVAESLPGLVQSWRDAFPDLEIVIRHLVTEDDLVAVSLVLRGTHEGPWWGVSPSGKRVEVEEMMFFRFEDDVLVEMWEVFDEHGLRAQIRADED